MKILIPFLLAAASLAVAQPAKDIVWQTSLPAAQKQAQAENKLIFMDVWTDWCGWCTKLRTGTFPSPEAKAVLANMVPLSVRTQDLQGKPTEEAWVQDKYKVEAYPMLIILRADGTVKARQAGYLDPVRFAAWVRENSK